VRCDVLCRARPEQSRKARLARKTPVSLKGQQPSTEAAAAKKLRSKGAQTARGSDGRGTASVFMVRWEHSQASRCVYRVCLCACVCVCCVVIMRPSWYCAFQVGSISERQSLEKVELSMGRGSNTCFSAGLAPCCSQDVSQETQAGVQQQQQQQQHHQVAVPRQTSCWRGRSL